MGSGWAPAVDALGAPDAEFQVTELPGFPPPAVEGHGGKIRSYTDRRQARPGLPGPHPLLRGPRRGRRRARRAHRRRRGLQDHRADQRLRRPARGHAPRPAGADQRPHQPDGHLADRRRATSSTSPTCTPRACAPCARRSTPRWRRASTRSSPARTTRPRPRSAWPASSARDLVGMSTVLEAIAAREAGAEVLGISLVTNLAAGMTGEPLNHEEVLQAGRDSAARMGVAAGAQVAEPPDWSASVGRAPADRASGGDGHSATGATAVHRPSDARGDDVQRSHRTGPGLAGRGPRPRDPRGAGQAHRRRGRRRSSTARFSGTLQFGTAGLRGELGAGPMRMNRAVVIRAAAGLAAYLQGRRATTGGLVVIGYDARHKSADFARDTAAVMTGAGPARRRAPAPAAHPRPGLRHTAPGRRRRRGGHRQPQPAPRQRLQGLPGRRLADRAARRRGDRRRDRRGAALWPTCPARTTGWQILGDEVAGRVPGPYATPYWPPARPAPPGPSTRRCTASARTSCSPPSPAPASPPRRSSPNRPSPTRTSPPWPSPTRRSPGAMDLAFAPARETGPDLDHRQRPRRRPLRRGRPRRRRRGWRMLRGDEVGALLAAHLVRRGVTRHLRRVHRLLLPPRPDRRAAGPAYEETLTGFKWIARVDGPALRLRGGARLLRRPRGRARQGRHHRGAAGHRAGLRAQGRRAARSLDLLDDLAVEHGLHATDQLSVRVEDLSVIAAAMRRLREQPPAALARSAGHLGRGPDRGHGRAAAHRRPALHLARTAPASSSGPAAPSPSSSATWRSWSRSPRTRPPGRPRQGERSCWRRSSRTCRRRRASEPQATH